MNFDEAEAKFRELHSRVQRGEPISRAEYEDQVSQLAVQDDRGVLWEINPRTGKWMYFDGAEWVGGTPPGRDQSTVMPMPPRAPTPPAPTPSPRPPTPATPLASVSASPPTRPAAPIPPSPRPPAPPSASVPASLSTGLESPELIQPYVRVSPDQPTASPTSTGGAPLGRGQTPPRVLRRGPLGKPNREWVPLAIGAIVLLLCAILLFFGGRFVLGSLGTLATPTRATLVPLATNTPMPTVVRLPTQPLPSATPAPVIAKVIEKTVNVRATPSTKAKVIGTLKKDNQISLTGRNEKGDWYQVNIAGAAEPGWVFGETLQIVSGDPKTLPVVGGATPTATKAATAPSAPQITPTLTPIGGRP